MELQITNVTRRTERSLLRLSKAVKNLPQTRQYGGPTPTRGLPSRFCSVQRERTTMNLNQTEKSAGVSGNFLQPSASNLEFPETLPPPHPLPPTPLKPLRRHNPLAFLPY